MNLNQKNTNHTEFAQINLTIFNIIIDKRQANKGKI